MNYEETIKWLYSFQRFGIKLGLDRISYISKELGNPHNNYKIIHVGGTNGKGSVCRFLESILNCSGYKVGVYTSPHLQHISERISINNITITNDKIVYLVNKIKPIINKMLKKNNSPTFFEIITAIAFQYFYDQNVDYAIIEVGLGGRYDSTNIVNPIVSIITNISLEHQNILGKNIKKITLEKAGIIKNNVPIITAAKKDSLKIINQIANEKNSNVYSIENKHWRRLNYNLSGQEFLINGYISDYNISTQMLGKYQGENIALAIYTIENLQLKGTYITETNIINGIKKTINIGRMEIVSHEPMIILDGAHNKEGIKLLINAIKNDFKYDKLIVILGILSDKKINSMIRKIIPISDLIITVKSNNKRALNPSILKDKIKKIDSRKNVIVIEKIKNAIYYAKSISKNNDLICITGSLYTVGEAREHIVNKS